MTKRLIILGVILLAALGVPLIVSTKPQAGTLTPDEDIFEEPHGMC